jgi:K+-sensing histidine kinase KdpD
MMATSQRPAVLSEQLLLSVAEQLKVPLLQIARRAELANLSTQHSTSEAFTDIQTTADMTIRLLDNYLFGARLALEDNYQLDLEPVSLSSVLYDTGQQLDAIAKLYGVDLELSLGGKFEPVLANRQGLQSALVSLGYALIEAMPNLGDKRMKLQLAAHRCRYGLVAGMYSEAEQLTAEALRQGRKLYGHSRQPLATLTHSSGAGIFVADAILQAMDSQLKVSRHHKLYGLGTVLHANPQLQLV